MAVLGLDTVYEKIPDRVKSRFWSIASVVYLHRPLHTSTILGIHSAVKDCSQLQGLEGGAPSSCTMSSVSLSRNVNTPSPNDDHEFLSGMKYAATDYLRHSTKQNVQQPDRNILTKQVCRPSLAFVSGRLSFVGGTLVL